MTLQKILKYRKYGLYRYKYMLVLYHERPKTMYSAMALVPPFILIWKEKQMNNSKLYKHECIHHRQILELFILPFFLWYILEYLISRLKGMKHYEAYRNISFEKEAYHGENISNYASRPRWYGFLKFYN